MSDRRNELTAWDRDHFFHPSTHMGMHARGETPTRVIGLVDDRPERVLDPPERRPELPPEAGRRVSRAVGGLGRPPRPMLLPEPVRVLRDGCDRVLVRAPLVGRCLEGRDQLAHHRPSQGIHG